MPAVFFNVCLEQLSIYYDNIIIEQLSVFSHSPISLKITQYAFKLAWINDASEMTVISDGLICSILNMIHRKSTACCIVNAIHVFTHLQSREHNSIRVPGHHCELLWTCSVVLSVKPYQAPEQVKRNWTKISSKHSTTDNWLLTWFTSI